MNRSFVTLGAVIAAVSLAACGGGATTPLISAPTPSSNPSANTFVAFSVTVPAAAPAATRSALRAPKFTAPSGAQSVSIQLTSVGGTTVSSTPTVANLAAGTTGCASGASGLTCTVTVAAQPGADVFGVKTFSAANGGGTVLGAGNVAVTATAGQTASAPTTLSGTVASIAITLVGDIPLGTSGNVALTIVAKDANGNAIIGTYSNAIALSDTDASAQTALSATNVPDSTTASAITLAYKGGVMSAPAVIGASASGVPAANVTAASFSPDVHYATTGSTTYMYKTTAATGAVNATPSPASTGSATLTETWSSGAYFEGVSNLEHLNRVFSNGVGITNRSDDYYYQWSAAAPYTLGFVGFNNPGIPEIYACAAPLSPVYVAGALSWNYYTNIGQCTDTYGPSTDQTNTLYSADGSYYSITNIHTTVNEVDTTTVHADGSALETTNNAVLGSTVTAIYTPAPNASTIPEYVASYPGALPSPLASPGPANTSEPNWYATVGLPNGVPPSPLQSDPSVTSTGTVTLPAACPVPASVLGSNPSITENQDAYYALDPTSIYSHGTDDTYLLNGVGVVCVVETYAFVYPGATTQSSDTITRYATASTLQAALKRSGFAQAVAVQSAMLVGGAAADRAEHLMAQRHAAMLRRVQSIRQQPR